MKLKAWSPGWVLLEVMQELGGILEVRGCFRSETVHRVFQWLCVLFGVLGFKYLDWPLPLFVLIF